MPLIQTVTVGDRTIDLHTFQGEVVEEKKWATTQVSGGGGGYNVGSGQQNPVTITSSTTTHDQFFLRNDAGQEMAFEIADASLALRKSHRVSVLWGIIKGNERGPFVAVYNHTTGNLTRIESGIRALAVPPAPAMIPIAYLASFVAICLYGVGIIALIVLLVMGSQRKKRSNQLMADFSSAVDAAIAQIKNQK